MWNVGCFRRRKVEGQWSSRERQKILEKAKRFDARKTFIHMYANIIFDLWRYNVKLISSSAPRM
jgi:ribosomal protein L18